MARRSRTQSTVEIERLAGEVMDALHEYKELTTEDMKKAVRKAAKVVKSEIARTAPKKKGGYPQGVRRTPGTYAKSWTSKVTSETSDSMHMTVYSKEYQLVHLLEYGHNIVRDGVTYGRTKPHPHVKQAEEKGIDTLEKEIRKALGG